MVAEATARELDRISLAEALELTILIGKKEPHRLPRVAVRWLERYLQKCQPTLAHSASSYGDRRPSRAPVCRQ
jgi:hypothetical protein